MDLGYGFHFHEQPVHLPVPDSCLFQYNIMLYGISPAIPTLNPLCWNLTMEIDSEHTDHLLFGVLIYTWGYNLCTQQKEKLHMYMMHYDENFHGINLTLGPFAVPGGGNGREGAQSQLSTHPFTVTSSTQGKRKLSIAGQRNVGP